MKRTLIIIFSSLLITTSFLRSDEGDSKNKIVRPVDTDKSMDRSVFQANYGQVWQSLVDLLSEYGFKFQSKDKSLGRFETNYVIFSRNPHFSMISTGFKAFAKPPRAFMRKWVDGRMKVHAEVQRVSGTSTQVILRPDIYGYASTFMDDSSVSGEWRQCQSNGKFEFEIFNEIATRLPKNSATTTSLQPAEKEEEAVSETTLGYDAGGSSNVLVSSVPEGAEILLNSQFVGMTPSRLSLKPGKYQVILRKDGYKKFFRNIVVIHGSDLIISTELKGN